MKRKPPEGYWTKVFEAAKVLLNSKQAATPEDAFWKARSAVDRQETLTLTEGE